MFISFILPYGRHTPIKNLILLRRTWSWGNRFLWQYRPSVDESLKSTYDYLTRNGVNWFDTADSYGTGDLVGRSETLLGEFHASSMTKSASLPVNFCTKIAPYPWRIGRQSFKRAHEESNTRLRRNADIVQLHWPPYLGWQEDAYISAMCDMVTSGSAKQMGLSNYGPKALKAANSFVSERGLKIHSNQVSCHRSAVAITV